MKLKVVSSIILICMLLVVFMPVVNVVYAATTDMIQITLSASNITGISNFTVTGDQNDTWIDTVGTWDNPPSLEYVIIRRSFTDYPATPTDGTLVYQGTGETFSETVTGIESVENIYYSAWVYDSGYSAPAHYLLEVETTMVNTLMLGILIFFALIPTIAGAILGATRGGGIVSGVAAIGWIVLGGFCYAQHEAIWDTYYIIFFASIFMVVICLLMPAMILRKRAMREDEENWGANEPLRQAIIAEERDEEMMNMTFGRRNKKKPRNKKKNDRFNQTGEL